MNYTLQLIITLTYELLRVSRYGIKSPPMSCVNSRYENMNESNFAEIVFCWIECRQKKRNVYDVNALKIKFISIILINVSTGIINNTF